MKVSFFGLRLFLFLSIGGVCIYVFVLPNLLGCVGKSRESEAKSTLGALTRAQQGYYTKKNKFASRFEELEVPIGGEKYYRFEFLAGKPIVVARGLDNNKNGTRDYIAGINYDIDKKTFSSVLCRSNNSLKLTNYTISEPSKAIINYGKVHSLEIKCGEGLDTIE